MLCDRARLLTSPIHVALRSVSTAMPPRTRSLLEAVTLPSVPDILPAADGRSSARLFTRHLPITPPFSSHAPYLGHAHHARLSHLLPAIKNACSTTKSCEVARAPCAPVACVRRPSRTRCRRDAPHRLALLPSIVHPQPHPLPYLSCLNQPDKSSFAHSCHRSSFARPLV